MAGLLQDLGGLYPLRLAGLWTPNLAFSLGPLHPSTPTPTPLPQTAWDCLSLTLFVPSLGAGVVGVGLGGYLIETTGSWTSVFNLVATVSSLGLCTFLMFGKAQRVDLSPRQEDL